MIKDVKIPELSESVNSADVVKVLVKLGDAVALEQPLLELETDKAVFELPSTEAGTVVEILTQKGRSVKVGEVVIRVETDGAAKIDAAPQKAQAIPASQGRSSAPAAPLPSAPAAPVRSAPAALPLSSPPAPSVPAAPAAPQPSAPAGPLPSAPAAPLPSAPAAPAVRRLARELGVDITHVRGTGPRGRISADDVKIHAKLVMGGQPAAAVGQPMSLRALPDFSRFGPVRREPMTKVRRITTESMAHAWSTVPKVTQYDKADVTDLEAFRTRHAKRVEAAGGKLTMTAILAKVVAGALRAFPQFNASLDVERGEIVFKEFVHVGVAVDTDRGLLVPVVRDADRKNIAVIAAEIAALAEKARTKRITPEEMEGGTFTISNLGGIGGIGFSPIVYWPQVAILGVSRAEMQPVWRGEGFEPRLVLPLSLSYDHRLIDGADGARFLRWVCQALEEPMLLALEG
jgi:pyruvate dehydrogenase E2 component (dihydrolipoamide acetyltransferase)